MTHEQRNAKIIAHIERYTKEKTATKEMARQTLIDEGIYTEDGELMTEFGGPPVSKTPKS